MEVGGQFFKECTSVMEVQEDSEKKNIRVNALGFLRLYEALSIQTS